MTATETEHDAGVDAGTEADVDADAGTDVIDGSTDDPPRWAGFRPSARTLSGVALAVVIAASAYTAIRLHRNGHTTGDDFALYIDQARSLFEGNIADVISKNRFLWEHSVGVTPQIYPWGFPILLSPIVRLRGIDAYGTMKLVEVACLCLWLVLFHGVVRRRAGRTVALALTALFATAPAYLLHTDQLLTELPHLAATGLFLWWLDRLLQRSNLTAAPWRDLAILGGFMVLAYNMRRESLVLVAVVIATQLVELARARPAWRSVPWSRLAAPLLTFVGGAFAFQLLLPSTLVPDNGNSRRYITDRLFTDYPKELTRHLGLGTHPRLGITLLALALVGAVVSCIRRPRWDVPLAVLCLSTMLVVGTHLRMVGRYYFQITPLIVYFVVRLGLDVVELAIGQRRLAPSVRRVAVVALLVPVLWTTAVHVWVLPARVDAAQRFNDAGALQSGGDTPRNHAAFGAIETYTREDDIVVFYRVRTMTLYTGRRGVQTSLLSKATLLADYFMQNLRSDYSQPRATKSQLLALGWEIVWEDGNWRLWRIASEPPDTADTVDASDSAHAGSGAPSSHVIDALLP